MSQTGRKWVRRYVAEVVDAGSRREVRSVFSVSPRTVPVGGVESCAAGDLVLVEEGDGEARVLGRPLAKAGSPRVAVYRIAARNGLDPVHPPEVHREARAWQAEPGLDDPGLEDLSALSFVTIDNPDSRDLDQALHIERDGSGYVVRYALADASYYVRPGTALFSEALARGASYYLPGLMVPMLPRSLCEGLISLNQDQLRRALVVVMRLNGRGESVETTIVRALVRSARKLSYPGVQRYYDDPAGSPIRGAAWHDTLDLLREVGRLRIAEARARHVVHSRRTELEVRLTEDHSLGFTAITDVRSEVERCNEQVSILCNVEGARLLAASRHQDHVQPVFRVHPAPSPAALDSLGELVDAIIARQRLAREVWGWRRGGGEPLADYLDRLPRHGAEGRIARAIERQARLLNERSLFETEPGAHHGVGAPVYARFSAPMREIVGVFTHKEALEMLAGPQASPSAAADLELREQVLEAGNRAKQVQRRITKEANKLVLDMLFSSDLGLASGRRPQRRGTILGMTPTRLYVQLDDPCLDVKVYLADLQAQTGSCYQVTADGVMARPETSSGGAALRVGGAVSLVVDGHDEQRQRWTFTLQR